MLFLLRWISRGVLIAFLLEAATAGIFLLTMFELVRLEAVLGPTRVILSFGERTFEALGPAWPVVPLLALYAVVEPLSAPFSTPMDVVGSLREAASADRRTAD